MLRSSNHRKANNMNPMRTFSALAATLLLAGAIPGRGLGDYEIRRPDLVLEEGDALVLSADPARERLGAAPPVLLHLSPPEEEISPAGLAVEVETNRPVALELVGLYSGFDTYVFPRRTVRETDRTTVRWDVENIDQLSSATVALRHPYPGAKARIFSAELRDFLDLDLSERLYAYTDSPLAVSKAATPVIDGQLQLDLRAPQSLLEALQGRVIFAELEGPEGDNTRERLQFSSLQKDVGRFAIELPEWAGEKATVRLVERLGNEERELASLGVDLRPLDRAHLEISGRSIEDISVIERNGELVIYSVVAAEGQRQTVEGVPLRGARVWLTVGDGQTWAVNEQLLRRERATDWIGGGIASFTAGNIGQRYFGLFTSVSAFGVETFSTAQSVNSLRLAALAKNPVWEPGALAPEKAPTWRGNAFFNQNGSPLIVSLSGLPFEETGARVLASPLVSRWTDLGELPLVGLNGMNAELSAYRQGNDFWLVAGPRAQVFYTSNNPLRGWEEEEFEAPEGWTNLELVDWDDATWLFGIQRRNGRGVAVWAPVTRENGRWNVHENRDRRPAPLRRLETFSDDPPDEG